MEPRHGLVFRHLQATLTVAEFEQFCRERLASFKKPSYWKFVDTFLMTVTGKVQKFRMREIAIDELNLRMVAAISTA